MKIHLYTSLVISSFISCFKTETNNTIEADLFEKIKQSPVVAGSIYLDDMLVELDTKDPTLSKNLSIAYEGIQNTQKNCAKEFAERESPTDQLKEITSHKWVIYATMEAKNNTGKFSDLLVDSSSSWPDFFDDELKKCYLDSIENSTFVAPENFSYKIMFKQCAVPAPDPEPASKK